MHPPTVYGMYLVIDFIIYQKRNDGMIVINRIGIYLNRIYMEIISRLIVSDFSISYLPLGRLIPNFCVSELNKCKV